MQIKKETYHSIMGFSHFDRLRMTLEVHSGHNHWTPSVAEVPNLKSDFSMNERMAERSRSHLVAFTLADVLAGMVIMSIVVAMVFGVFNMVNRQTQDFQSLRIELNDFVLMQADLQRQIDACEEIYQVPSGFVLKKGEEELKYYTSEGALMRQSDESLIAIHPAVSDIQIQFEDDRTVEQPLISSIEIKTVLREMELSANFSKQYSNADRINQTLLNEY